MLDFKEWYQPIHEAIHRGLHILKPDSDDSTVIVTASTLLEKLLEFAILLHFGPLPSEEDMKLLFKYPGPLSSFAAKINLCAVLGIITPQVRKDLDLIRDTRNKFCHTLFKRSFDDEDIAKLCSRMRWGIESGGPPFEQIEKAWSRHGSASRIRFIFTCLMVGTILIFMFTRKFHELKALEQVKEEAHRSASEVFDTNFKELMAAAAANNADKDKDKEKELTVEQVAQRDHLVTSIRASILEEVSE